jgi:murein DD-endopeptidase MepM/ murein hydrolase activator NlpD
MRTAFAAGLVSVGVYIAVLGLAPAAAQTTAVTSPAEPPATPEPTPEEAALEPAPDAAPPPPSAEPPVEAPTPTPTPPEATPEPQQTPVPEPSPAPPETPTEPAPAPAAAAAPAPEAAAPAVADAPPADAGVPARPARRRVPGGRAGGHVGKGDDADGDAARRERTPSPPTRAPRLTRPDGSPAPTNPYYALATPGPAPIGVPDFFIDKFRIPPFLLPIYQAAGVQYGVQWEILAAINEIETDYGRNLNTSSAGAVGWMQFMPATWAAYGVDASGDGVKDPYNPVDAVFAAARYLRAAGADEDIRRAVFAYNHADWYVDAVLMRAKVIGGLPSDLVGSLTGLTEGRFPVEAEATYSGSRIYARTGARVVAVTNGRIVEIGYSERLGRHVVLRDVYGNTYTYGNLGETPEIDPARPKGVRVTGGTILGRVGAAPLRFEIRPAGRGAPRIDPKPILDGWKLLESTAVYRADGKNPFFFAESGALTVGQLLLLGKEELIRRVLGEPRIQISGCGAGDVRSGQIDRRVLATMLYLAASGLKPTVSSLKCGHSRLTSSGNVSEHSTGTAMDIAAVNGVVIGPSTQGPGSITDATIRALLELQGALKPHQIISLMSYDGADNTLAMEDHGDHIHVGWRPDSGMDRLTGAVLRPDQWIKLIDRLADIGNPTVPERGRVSARQ